jgi:hypothetical protein
VVVFCLCVANSLSLRSVCPIPPILTLLLQFTAVPLPYLPLRSCSCFRLVCRSFLPNRRLLSSCWAGLTEAQRDRLMQVFRWADHDRDSYLSEREFQLWCDKVGLSDLYDQCVCSCSSRHPLLNDYLHTCALHHT